MEKNEQLNLKSNALRVQDLWKGANIFSWNASTTHISSHMSLNVPLSVDTFNKEIFGGETTMEHENNKPESETYCLYEWISIHLIDHNIGPNSVKEILKTTKVRSPIRLYNLYIYTLSLLDFFEFHLNVSPSYLRDEDLYNNYHLFGEFLQNKTCPSIRYYKSLMKKIGLSKSNFEKVMSRAKSSSCKPKFSSEDFINPYFEAHKKYLRLLGIKEDTIRQYSQYHYLFVNWLIKFSCRHSFSSPYKHIPPAVSLAPL
jgi:hypothetical protein